MWSKSNFTTPAVAAISLGLIGGSTVLAGEPQIPGTLNFENVTNARINQTVDEVGTTNEKAVEFGDFDNDNDLDVVIAVAFSDFSQRKNKMYRNDGGVFNEISATVPQFPDNDVARAAFFRDYDDDGWLDLIIVCDSNTAGEGGDSKYWRNVHSDGVHTGWVREDFRLGTAVQDGAGSGAVSADNDGDGDFDLYIGNQPNDSQDGLYLNAGNGFFTDFTGTHVPSEGNFATDVSSADINGDGMLDLLVSNSFNDDSFIYYNNNNGAGSGEGDYRYSGTGAKSLFSNTGGNAEKAMEPGDFDGDGDQDFYYSNRGLGGPNNTSDAVLQNTGNDRFNRATFATIFDLPPSVQILNSESIKATVSDLNDDNRLDVVVMRESGISNNRPAILRNTTVNGNISFVDWTPAPAFPNGNTHKGWHAAVFDTNNDGDLDIFLGGFSDDHLFENVPSNEMTEDDVIGGNLPPLFNLDPIALVGTAGVGETDEFIADDIGPNSFISVVLNGADDYLLEMLDSGNNVIGSSDRGGLGIEEALQVTTSAGTYTIQVTTQACAATADLDGDCNVGSTDLLALLVAWGPNPGHPADFDEDGTVGATDLLTLLVGWGPSEYVLEVLSRTGP